MSDVTSAMAPKSDQLNADDLVADSKNIVITRVNVTAAPAQPVSIFFEGDNGKPWKPCKGMIRVLAMAWGKDSAQWVGKSATLFRDDEVIYAGQAVGGIRISHLSHINKTMTFSMTVAKSKRVPFTIQKLTVAAPAAYPPERFDENLPAMIDALEKGSTQAGIIAQCEKTGTLTDAQKAAIVLPVEPETTGQPTEQPTTTEQPEEY